MSDDPLDDAIDAVVRAVDRIERATRDAGLEAQQLQAAAGEIPASADAGPLPPAASATPASAGSAEIHELVGRIIGAAQSLDDHLEAARVLRAEVAELVSRLAAATSQR